MSAPEPLSADALRWRCPPDSLGFETTAEVRPEPSVVGQDKAVEALQFGLHTRAPGHNVFVRGLTGTGRMTVLRLLLEKARPSCPEQRDYCYVRNFAQSDRPKLVSLAPGQGRAFRASAEELISFLEEHLLEALQGDSVRQRRKALEQRAEKEVQGLIEPFSGRLQEEGFSLVMMRAGPHLRPAIFPVHEGNPLTPEQFAELRAKGEVDEERAQGILEGIRKHQEELEELATRVQELQDRHHREMRAMLRQEVKRLVEPFLQRIAASFPGPPVKTWTEGLQADLMQRLEHQESPQSFTSGYLVNLVRDSKETGECPIVLETVPKVTNLAGTIAWGQPEQFELAEHLRILPGALLRADGGFLVLEAHDVLVEPGAWNSLVRTLRSGLLEVGPPEGLGPWAGPPLKPEPVPIQVKVVLLGDGSLFQLLDSMDRDFPHLFKVLADFDNQMPRDEGAVSRYAAVLARIAREHGLLPFHNGAVALLAEQGARIAGRSDRLTTRFGRLADIAQEAAFLAQQEEAGTVRREHVARAIERGKGRADLPARRFRELITDDVLRIQCDGSQIGQVNGLAVAMAGPFTFGFPARITATIGPGTAGTINVERESLLSGAIHTKGFHILGGLLRKLLPTDHPLAFTASLAFEQSYGGIDGDSASGAEACCLLSALGGVPLRQDLAMTGAIDQHGHVQAVGAVNEKIEGFYDVCAAKGLTGTQGVLIPAANARDLMLRSDVVEACAAGRFSVRTLGHITEALELLTGMAAGELGEDGRYPEDSLLGQAMARARRFWRELSAKAEAAARLTEE